ncbi:hypothetical protein AVEN_141027-1 [Araneus ventricosus]|uniref:Uncharacterized protein n=1 Tax=Araneus ventricosus TaxID=182803 RepID=A0A4Y2Q9W3_ARAVE|nr:hypothetical protein AVEN_141027-1 [Araneus ventricosus]
MSVCWRCTEQTVEHRATKFGTVKTSGYKIEYPNLPSTVRPVPQTSEIPVPVFKELPSLEIKEYQSGEGRSDPNDDDFEIEHDFVRKGFKQHELNELARDLGLSKKASELLASRLHDKNLLEKGDKV